MSESVASRPDEAAVDSEATDSAAPAPAGNRARIIKLVVALVGLGILLYLPLVLASTWLRVGEYVMIGAVAAMGLTLLTGHAGQLSLGTPFFMLLGGTVYATVSSTSTPGEDLVAFGLPPMLGLVLAVVVAALAGLAFAPVSGRVGGIYLSMATLSLVYIGLFLGQRFASLTGGVASGRPAPPLTVFGFSLTTPEPPLTVLGVPFGTQERMWYLFLVLTIGGYFLARGAITSRPGRAWRSVRDNPYSAAAMGVQVARVRAGAFAVSSAYAGLAGVMVVVWFGLLKADENEFTGSWSIQVAVGLLAMIIIGGLGSVGGAVLGSLIIFGMPLALQLLVPNSTFLSNLTTGSNGFTPVVISTMAYGFLVVLVVLFEPGGLAGIGRRLAARTSRAQSSNRKRNT